MQNARVSISMLGDGDKTDAHKITKDLKMFLLVINRRIRTHREEISLTYFLQLAQNHK
jgi:hypothetical protein